MGGNNSSELVKKVEKPLPPQLSEADKSILEIKRVQSRLIKNRTRYEEDCKRLYFNAQKLKSENFNERAMILLRLRRSKMKETQNIEANISTLEELKNNVEIQMQQSLVLNMLAEGTRTLEMLNNQMPLEMAEKILDDTQAALEAERQLRELLTGNFSAEEDVELEDEFAKLGIEEKIPSNSIVEILPLPPSQQPMPTVPKDKVKIGSNYHDKTKVTLAA